MAQLNFDATQVDPQDSFDVIPAGDYTAYIIESEIKPTKAGNGHYLQLTFKIHGGKCDGRLLWERLNISNPNKTAEEIANKTLSSICHAVNVMNVQDSEQLHGKPLEIKVKVKSDPNYGDRNEIAGYKSTIGFAQVPVAKKSSLPPAASEIAKTVSAPWLKG